MITKLIPFDLGLVAVLFAVAIGQFFSYINDLISKWGIMSSAIHLTNGWFDGCRVTRFLFKKKIK